MSNQAQFVRAAVVSLLALGFLPTTLQAQAVSCGNARISYVQTGNGPDVTELCSSGSFTGVCQVPILDGPTYSFTPGCSPYFGTCDGSATFEVEFPGNHNNGFNSFFSFATVELRTLGGALIGDCGHPGATITQDFGTFTVTGGANCNNQGVSTANVVAFTCRNKGECHKQAPIVRLDFDLAGGCLPPLMQACNGDASCTDCTAGGAGPGGGGPGLGGPGGPQTGPGATLRYAARGAGHPGLPGSPEWNQALGLYWSHDYAQRIVPVPDESKVWLITEHATYREFSNLDGTTGVYGDVAPSSEKRTLTWLGAGSGWELRDLRGSVTLFDASGLWRSMTDRNGTVTEGFYTGSQLDSVELPDGRREDFTYDPGTGKLQTIAEVGVDLTTQTWTYGWSDGGAGEELERIDRPDGTALVFTYADARYPGYVTRMELEGTDETSLRVLRAWEYDEEGNVTKTWKGDVSPSGPDAVDLWGFSFDDPAEPVVTTVTPPIGGAITYTLGRDTVSENTRVEEISGDCPTCGLGPNSQLSYEDSANPLLPTTIVDGRGTIAGLEYDAFGQLISRTEAEGDPQLQRITSFTYSPTYPALMTSMSQPSVAGGAALRETVWTLDASGNVTDREVFGFESGSALPPLKTEITPNAQGQPVTIDPPGHGTADVTSFTYDPARGNLIADTRNDPVVGTTTFGHDAFNRRTLVTDPNGVLTKTSYDELDRVTEVRQEGASPGIDDLVTTHEYTVFGDLFRTTLPEGNVVEYGYDAAGRLTSVERKPDAATHGERVFYTLDAAGNRTLEELQRWDADASAWVTLSSTEYVFTNRCQVDRIIQAPETEEVAVTVFQYDCNGNLEHQWDPNHDPEVHPATTSYVYDALDRLTAVTQPWSPPEGGAGLAVTTYDYDVQDHLTSVTDAEGNVTEYTYSDRDLLTHEVSQAFIDPSATCNPAPACDPGCGCTAHTYDEHGELDTTLDARGVLVDRTVDVLDRVTFVDYLGTDLDTTYTYDTEPLVCAGAGFPVGRLASITRGGEAVEYCYDRFGRPTRDGELTYTHDGNGNRTGIGYPGGVVATYTHDFADREVTLSVTTTGGAEPVVQAASYLPSGPLSTLLLGSGVTETRGFDGRYVPASIALAGALAKTFTYTTDPVGNILEIVEQGACTPGPVVLENQTVTTTETFTSCTTIEAGNGFTVESPGDVSFQAQGTIALKDGFSVGTGARFVAGSGEIPPLSVRTYAYQAPQYFLTAADGPWGTIDWSYDKIGNRLTESRDEGATTDGYVYATNGSGGNTPILDLINLAVGGTRDYTWGAAGHLEEVAAGANVIDFAADAEGRLSRATRTAADVSAAASYDGRSFLRRAVEMVGDPPAEGASVDAVYDSDGLLHALRRKVGPTDPEELVVHFYLAGRPLAQLAIDGADAETWSYITTDHLGTPFLATDDIGAVMWEGGFLPFGGDYQAETPAGALENGVFLRLPGQWQDSSWNDATSGAGLSYNLARWVEPHAGRYTRPDPAGHLGDPHPYLYARANPVLLSDFLGLKSRVCCTPIAERIGARTFKHCFLEIEDDQAKKETHALHGMGTPRRSWGGPIGCTFPNDGFDRDAPRRPGYECGPWKEDCETDECVRREAGNYPRASRYKLRGPNSNTFAGNIARACNLEAPPVVGWQTPGWGDAPPPGLFIPSLHGGLHPFPCPGQR